MPAPDFLDTNVLVYAYDDGQPRRQSIARDLLRQALAGEFVVSVQVLMEFTVTLLYKFSTPVSPQQMTTILDAISPLRLVPPDKDTVRRAVEAHSQYGVHFYDGMILAAAERAGSQRIWSEDLNPGQKYFGITVENPFS